MLAVRKTPIPPKGVFVCGNTVLHKVLGVGKCTGRVAGRWKTPFGSELTLSHQRKETWWWTGPHAAGSRHFHQRHEVDAHDALQEMTLRTLWITQSSIQFSSMCCAAKRLEEICLDVLKCELSWQNLTVMTFNHSYQTKEGQSHHLLFGTTHFDVPQINMLEQFRRFH